MVVMVTFSTPMSLGRVRVNVSQDGHARGSGHANPPESPVELHPVCLWNTVCLSVSHYIFSSVSHSLSVSVFYSLKLSRSPSLFHPLSVFLQTRQYDSLTVVCVQL